MQDGDRYVVNSQNSLYYLPNSTCSEGDTVVLNNSSVQRVYNINGVWLKADLYTTGSYNSSSYICHVWSDTTLKYNPNYILLPAVIVVLCFFSIIWSWYSRLRG